MDGIIKALVKTKGFGFIRRDDGVDAFFHASSVLGKGFDELRPGDSVSFDLETNARGGCCLNVVFTSPAPEGKHRGSLLGIHPDYCFIRPNGEADRLFAHRSEFDREVDEADHDADVAFDIVTGNKGRLCKNVHVLTQKLVPVPATGVITKVFQTFGFVARDSDCESIYFSFQSPETYVTFGDIGRPVAFEVIDRAKGPAAIRLQFID